MKNLRRLVEGFNRKTKQYERFKDLTKKMDTETLRLILYGWNTQADRISRWTLGITNLLPADSEMLAYKDALSKRIGREAYLA